MNKELNEVELWRKRKQRKKYISIAQGVLILLILIACIIAAIRYKIL